MSLLNGQQLLNTIGDNKVSFSAAPAVFPTAAEGHFLIVTDDGTSLGEVLETYTYDGNNNVWIKVAELDVNIPTPILELGYNFTLQHSRGQSIGDLESQLYTSSGTNLLNPGLSQKGVDWANNSIYVGVSYARTKNQNYKYFLNNSPMIFMEVLNTKGGRSNRQLSYAKPYFSHPINKNGQLNRVGSNYGGGDPSSLVTEFNFTPTTAFKNEIIEIDPKAFYRVASTLPQRWVDFISLDDNALKWQRNKRTIVGNNQGTVINTFVQPIRFRFACLAKDGKTVYLGEPSDTVCISPKWGEFNDNDTYVYDWQINFHR